ncbi:uracil-DNA glycosylase [Bacillus sp. M6-12]|uniref:uracil-DNA glycosylase n=1 Tax=Bacillus sp. M6-12 TaxID=2054166 RepID=UPI000C785FA9|nr:uracil-DNA glycosylase [Bacillus sp. M6-12]PLS19384.1 uracil-DNA glycosylase [Bacillus sp. M6-12]
MSQSTSLFLKNLSIHDSWESFFNQSHVINELQKIEQSIISKPFTPKAEVVLRFATLNVKELKVIVLGKDPYPQQKANGEFVATGRAFEVSGATSWFQKEINPSLKNVIKLIHKSYFDLEMGLSINEVRNDMEIDVFPIPTPDKAFGYWENQGVLFLNTAFTCEVGGIQQAGSHLSLWKPFFQMLIEYLSNENPDIRYFLWGDARKYGKTLRKLGMSEDLLYESKHPCTNGDSGGYEKNSSFLMNPCFYETKNIISWTDKNVNV